MEINAEFFYNRMYLAFLIQHSPMGKALHLIDYNWMQDRFWEVSEKQNVIWGKTNDNLQP